MAGILFAIITVLAWGTWLAPSQNVRLKNQQIRMFYVAAVNLVLAFVISLLRGLDQLTPSVFWPPFVGGLIWSLSGLCAFTAANKIGMARAFGLWAPLNILVSLVCGRVLFHEFVRPEARVVIGLVVAITLIVAGVLLIIFSKGGGAAVQDPKAALVGFACAVGAGVLWGVYFVPIKLSGVSMWIAALPMAVGIFVGSGALSLLGRESVRLPSANEYLRLGSTGVLWTIGNYGMLLLVEHLGAGRGYTIAQLSVVVNALVGIYALHDPVPGSRAARMTLMGCIVATVGGILLGNLK